MAMLGFIKGWSRQDLTYNPNFAVSCKFLGNLFFSHWGLIDVPAFRNCIHRTKSDIVKNVCLAYAGRKKGMIEKDLWSFLK